jgi:hypothetical protein
MVHFIEFLGHASSFPALFGARRTLAPCPMVLEKIYVGMKMANKWTDPTSLLILGLAGGIPTLLAAEIAIGIYFGVAYMAVIPVVLTLWYKLVHLNTAAADTEAFLIFKVRSFLLLPMHGLISHLRRKFAVMRQSRGALLPPLSNVPRRSLPPASGRGPAPPVGEEQDPDAHPGGGVPRR